ncbi:MAG: isochorismatase family cysteine hydrolase [Acidimicrobiia bacterium]
MHVIDTDPYPWPYDGALDVERTAVLACGVQRRWGGLDPRATERVVALADAMRAVGALVVFVRHARLRDRGRPGPDLPVAGDRDAELLAIPADGDVVIDATTHDGFLDTPLDATLRAVGVDHLLLVGLAYESVVDSTLRSANDRGYECLVVTDATAPFDVPTAARAHDSVTKSGGIFGALGTTAAVAAAYGFELDPH